MAKCNVGSHSLINLAATFRNGRDYRVKSGKSVYKKNSGCHGCHRTFLYILLYTGMTAVSSSFDDPEMTFIFHIKLGNDFGKRWAGSRVGCPALLHKPTISCGGILRWLWTPTFNDEIGEINGVLERLVVVRQSSTRNFVPRQARPLAQLP